MIEFIRKGAKFYSCMIGFSKIEQVTNFGYFASVKDINRCYVVINVVAETLTKGIVLSARRGLVTHLFGETNSENKLQRSSTLLQAMSARVYPVP